MKNEKSGYTNIQGRNLLDSVEKYRLTLPGVGTYLKTKTYKK